MSGMKTGAKPPPQNCRQTSRYNLTIGPQAILEFTRAVANQLGNLDLDKTPQSHRENRKLA
jgi:hypothetical protein